MELRYGHPNVLLDPPEPASCSASLAINSAYNAKLMLWGFFPIGIDSLKSQIVSFLNGNRNSCLFKTHHMPALQDYLGRPYLLSERTSPTNCLPASEQLLSPDALRHCVLLTPSRIFSFLQLHELQGRNSESL